MQNVCVLGLGYIGLPTTITLALSGLTVRGVDIREDVVKTLSGGALTILEPGLPEAFRDALGTGKLTFSTELAPADVFIITVQTPQTVTPDGRHVADLRFVFSAAESIAPHLKPGNLVVLESTVPPGTCRRMHETLAERSGLSPESFHTAHCPERVIPGRILEELRCNDRIIGGSTPEATEAACALYGKVVTKGKLRQTDDVSAEMCKLVENTYRDVNIAYANELSVVAQKLGIDVFHLIELANCHPRVNILTPGVGVGGHCIAIDPWFIHETFPEDTPLIAQARRTNDEKPYFVASTVASRVAPGARVAVLGLSYKPDIDDLRESASLTLCHALKEKGFVVVACEPHVEDDEVQGFPNLSLKEALQSDFVVITLKHTQFVQNAAEIAKRPHYDCVGLIG